VSYSYSYSYPNYTEEDEWSFPRCDETYTQGNREIRYIKEASFISVDVENSYNAVPGIECHIPGSLLLKFTYSSSNKTDLKRRTHNRSIKPATLLGSSNKNRSLL
jgi:hypothetical protein